MPISWHSDPDLQQQALRLAIQHELPSAHDAHYLALAERLSIELWTANAQLVAAVEDRVPWVRLVS